MKVGLRDKFIYDGVVDDDNVFELGEDVMAPSWNKGQ